MANLNDIDTGLYSALGTVISSTSATDAYNQVADQGATLPYIVFGFAGGGDENQTSARSKDLVYTVKAVAADANKSGWEVAGSIDASVDAQLHLSKFTISNWQTFWLARQAEIRFVETTEDGERYYHVGGEYRLRVEES